MQFKKENPEYSSQELFIDEKKIAVSNIVEKDPDGTLMLNFYSGMANGAKTSDGILVKLKDLTTNTLIDGELTLSSKDINLEELYDLIKSDAFISSAKMKNFNFCER